MAIPNDPRAPIARRLGAEVVHGEMTDVASLAAAVAGIERVIHLAHAGHGAPDQGRYFAADVDGAWHLLRAAAKAGARRFVFASSMTVYGRTLYTPILEDHPYNPEAFLGLMKRLVELAMRQTWIEHGLSTAALRFTWVLAGEDPLTRCCRVREVMRRIPAAYAEHERIVQWRGLLEGYPQAGTEPTAGVWDEAGRPWLLHPVDVRDVAQGVALAVESDKGAGEAFNLSGPAAVAYDQGARYLASALGQDYVEARLPYRSYQEISSAKARRVFGYIPQYDFFRMVDTGLALRRGEDVGLIL
jgi:UDP-glucose 4-epimerase